MSSPFNPLTALTPAPQGLTPLQIGHTPHPFLQPSPGASPAVGGGAGTPWLNLVNLNSSQSVPVPPNATNAGAVTDADDAIRAIPEISRLLERAESVRNEIDALEKGLFVLGEGAERAGGLCRLEGLQLDYAQTLLALISLSSTYLVGALPVNLASIENTSPSELAAWTEARAQTMFNRREAVRGAMRAVGDVFKGSKQ